MRAYGRGFEEFYHRGRDETGVNFIKSSPASITAAGDDRLLVRYEDPENARPASVEVDLVVLTCAMIPSAGTPDLAAALGIEVDKDGYFRLADPLADPVASTRQGVYLCGCASGPKDIPDSVAQASAAGARALAYLGEDKSPVEEGPLPMGDPDEEPRIGVFVCHCGHNIGGVVDSKAVAEFAARLPGVAYATDNLYTCSDDTQTKMEQIIRKKKLNRVVVAACTPRTHEPLFRETCTKAGLNPYLFDMANIRDQCSWVHSDAPRAATEKSKDLVRMAAFRAMNLKPLQRKRVEIDRSALVVGGGISGIQCAIDIARQGLDVVLLEKEPELGGLLRSLDHLFPSGTAASELLAAKIEELESLPVAVIKGREIDAVEGFVGNFEVKIGDKELKTGAIVLATGGIARDPEGRLGYDRFANVITSSDFEKILAEKATFLPPDSKTGDGEATETETGEHIVFIQCAGSREKVGYTGCSRYCCQVSLKQALEAVRRGARATIIHRDIRSFTRYGEDLYRQAREAGISFIRRKDEDEVDVRGNGRAESLAVFDTTLLSDVELECDTVVLAVPLLPSETTGPVGEMLRIPLGSDGFFLEKHIKLGPLETNTEGIFLCGCAQYPKDIPDSLAQASGVAAKVGALLSKPYVNLEPATAYVRRQLCRACGRCVDICEYHAPELKKDETGEYVEINEALCKGCGTCASHCPTGAVVAKHYTDNQIESMIDILFKH
jgi:heterodisulfide reductase subunit A